MTQHKESRTKKVASSVFNLRGWFDYDRIRSYSKYLSEGIKKMVVPRKSSEKKQVSFAEMAAKMNLTEAQLKKRCQGLYRLSLLMTAIAIGIFSYSIYHLFHLNLKAGIVSFIVTFVALALAFRYHFWYFQIKNRKLGCTFREWYEQGLLRKK